MVCSTHDRRNGHWLIDKKTQWHQQTLSLALLFVGIDGIVILEPPALGLPADGFDFNPGGPL